VKRQFFVTVSQKLAIAPMIEAVCARIWAR